METPYRYRSPDEDSGRWSGFPFRPGDIVISTRSKHGTTWMQMICALLVLGGPPPVAISELSPWLDFLVTPRDQVLAMLERQQHRRFIKTHTPLDGVPLDPRVTYVVVARHPLDAAVSLYHQGENMNREVLRQLTGQPEPAAPPPPRPPLTTWLRDWISEDADPRQELDSLAGVMWHLSDAWSRRDDPHVVLIRYAGLVADLGGQMRQLAARLGIAVPDHDWPRLVEAAGLEAMRQDADRLAPAGRVLKSSQAFFRRGRPGAAAELLTPADLDTYTRRAATLAPPDLLSWLHR